MDFLNKTFGQTADLFRSMTPATRITTGLLLAVVVVSLGYLFAHQSSGPEVDLMNGVPVPAGDIAAMEAAFHAAGLSSYEIRGTQILVPRGQKAAYIAAAAEAKALPPNIGEALEKVGEASGPFITKGERESLEQVAMQKTLSQIICAMPGIESAYVIYDEEVKPGLLREKMVTATASAKAVGNGQLDERLVSAIRHLVAGAIAGLKPESVTVADLNGMTYYGSADSGSLASENLAVSLKHKYEQEWRAKILNSLSYIRGLNVEANVVLDRDRINRLTSIEYETKGFAVHESEESSDRSREESQPAGGPGLRAQGNVPQALSAARTAGSNSTESGTKREVVSVPNSKQTEMEQIGLTPKRVSVAVGVPNSYFKNVWLQQNPAEEGQQPATPDAAALTTLRDELATRIQAHVAALLPPADGVDDPTQLVTVTTFEDLPAEALPASGFGVQALEWFRDYWRTLGMLGLAALSLVMLRSMIKAVPEPAPTATGPQRIVASPEGDQEDEEELAEQTALNRLKRFTGSGRSIRDELSELVQEDPDTAAGILRNWISHVN